MIDYSEGYLALKQKLDVLWQATLEKRYNDARGLCDEIVVEARMIKGQLKIQADKEERNG